MDPASAFALAASIITLTETTAKVLKYLNDVKNAPKERAKLAHETASLLALLTDLRYVLEEEEEDGGHEQWLVKLRLLDGPDGPLFHFRESMEALAVKLEPATGVKKAYRGLRWPLDRKDADEHLAKIERTKSFVSIAIQRDHLYETELQVWALTSERVKQALHSDQVGRLESTHWTEGDQCEHLGAGQWTASS